MANEELREQNYQKVLETGLILFYQKGIENTRIKEIAKESGISVRSVSRYFANKDDFVIAVLENFIEKQNLLFLAMMENVENRESCGRDNLQQFLEMAKNQLMNKPHAFLLLADAELYLSRHNKNTSTINSQILSFCQMAKQIRQYLNEGIADGSITKISICNSRTWRSCRRSYPGFVRIRCFNK